MSRRALLAVASVLLALVAGGSLNAQTNATTVGTVAAVNASCSSVTATATFTGDANNNGTTTFEYNTSNTWPGTASCTVSGPSPRVCTITGLVSPNTYWVRATYADADGVVGTNPTAGVSTGAPLPACGADTMPPTVTILSPSRNAVIGGTETVKVQAFDAVAMNATPVLFSVDGGALSATGVTVSPNYACDGSGPAGKCKVYLVDVNTTILANGPHYLTVQAVDAAGNRTTLSWGVRVNNTGSTASGSGRILRRTGGAQLCQDCHALETHSSQYNTTTYGNWSVDCLGCHTSHGTTNIYLVKPAIDTPGSGSKPVTFRNTTGVATDSYGTPQASGNGVNVCEVCHTRTKNSDATARARNNAPTDWTKHYTGRCTTCHSHKEGFAAGESGGGVACAGCHSGIWNRMQASGGSTYRHTLALNVSADDTVTWGSPLAGNAAGVRSCVNMCHDDHPHTATDDPSPTLHYNLAYADATTNASRAATTRTVATKARTDFDASLANGGLCVSCHRYPVEAAPSTHPAVSKANYAAGAHNVTATTPGGSWQYTLHDGSNFVRNCTKCHWDSSDGTTPTVSGRTAVGAVHGNANPSLLMGTTNPAGAPAAFVCYRCHGGGATGADYSSKAVYQDGTKAYKHPTDADTVHVSPTEANTAAWGNTLGVTGRHANCLDCHDPHEARPTAPLVQYATGTATATSGGTTVTGTGTSWTSTHVGWRIRNNSVGVWHTVTAVGTGTSLTISPGATAAWSGAYTLEAKPNFYNVGTATFTLNSASVTGTGTSWTSAYNGWYIRSSTNTLYKIAAVTGPTALTLTANYATATLTSAYTIAAGNVAGPGLQGAWGAQLSSVPALWTAPGSGNFTKKTVAAGTDLEATLCFKCHSSWYWGAGTPPNGISPNGTATNPVETDIAMELNPNNKSGHPVLASLSNFAGSATPKALAAAQMLAPWNVAVGTQTMTCSDCHNTDAASPAAQGPHGSAVTFLIRNGDKKPGWPTAAATAAGFATTFCSDCHVNANIHTRKSDHSALSCYRCHIVIPHGGKMSRLIASSASGTTMPARYAYSNTLSNVYITKFTKAASDGGYVETNCGTNNSACTGKHPSTDGTESW